MKIRKRKVPDAIANRGGPKKYGDIYDAIHKLEIGDAFLCFHEEEDDDAIVRAAQAFRGYKKRSGVSYRVFVDLRPGGDRGIWVERIK